MTALGLRRPGIYTLPSERYHRDPVVRPSLNHSVLRLLLDKSPMHARAAHPRLNPDIARKEPSDAMLAGTVLHRLILGRGETIRIVEETTWRGKAAASAWDEAMEAGEVPILAHKFAELRKCADAVVSQLRADPEAASFFAPGKSEAIAIARVGPVWLRCMVDRLPDAEGAPLWDMKSTGQSARPADWERSLANRHATQAAFYRWVVGTALKRPVGEMRFAVFERDPPYAVSIVSPGETMMDAAEAEVRKGIEMWARCMVMDDWPGYGRGVHRIEAPVHMLARAEAAKLDFGRMAA